MLEAGSSGYSSPAELADGRIGVLYERARSREIAFRAVPLEQLTLDERKPAIERWSRRMLRAACADGTFSLRGGSRLLRRSAQLLQEAPVAAFQVVRRWVETATPPADRTAPHAANIQTRRTQNRRKSESATATLRTNANP